MGNLDRSTSLMLLGLLTLRGWLGRCTDAMWTRVLSVVHGEQPLLLVVLREHEEDEHGAEEHRDDACRVCPVVAVEERLLRAGDDRFRVLRMLLGNCLGAGERLRQLRLGLDRDLVRRRDLADTADAYPAVSNAPKIDCMIAPPRSR